MLVCLASEGLRVKDRLLEVLKYRYPPLFLQTDPNIILPALLQQPLSPLVPSSQGLFDGLLASRLLLIHSRQPLHAPNSLEALRLREAGSKLMAGRGAIVIEDGDAAAGCGWRGPREVEPRVLNLFLFFHYYENNGHK